MVNSLADVIKIAELELSRIPMSQHFDRAMILSNLAIAVAIKEVSVVLTQPTNNVIIKSLD